VGDLNSDLNSGIPGVVELLRSGRLAADHWDWRDGAAFRWGRFGGGLLGPRARAGLARHVRGSRLCGFQGALALACRATQRGGM
jgi:hypothetical protein